MSLVELLERKAARNGYPGITYANLRKYDRYSPRWCYFWLIVQALTGLVPFPILAYLKTPGRTAWLVWSGVGMRLYWWRKRHGL